MTDLPPTASSSGTPPAGPDLDALAADWVLGLAQGADLATAERLAVTDPAFMAAAAAWRRRLAELDETAPPAAVPPGLWPSLLRRLDEATADPADMPPGETRETVIPFRRPAGGTVDPQTAPQPRMARLWSSVAVWRAIATAASVAAAVILGAYLDRPAPRAELVAVLLVEPGKPGAVVEAFADGRVRLVPLQDLPVPTGRALQVWTLRDRVQGPVSVGLMPRARTLPLDLGTLPGTAPDQLFEITLEPETGSPTGKPTGPVLMKGLAARTL
jgi:anti-sigma-K factor RskA